MQTDSLPARERSADLVELIEELCSRVRAQTAMLESATARIDRFEEELVDIHELTRRADARMNRLRRLLTRPPLLFHSEPEQEFVELLAEVQKHGTTSLGPDRLYVLWQAARNVRNLPGVAAEVGTYRGGSAYFMAKALRYFDGSEPEVHVIDTFEGHPSAKISKRDVFHTAGLFSDTSFEKVSEYLAGFPRLEVHNGEFSHVAGTFPDQKYRIVHIDTDLYQPTLDCLHYFGPRLVKGGIILVDDYGAEKCQPVVDAVTEFLAGEEDYHVWDLLTEQAILLRQ
jgi:O-methyltransferase